MWGNQSIVKSVHSWLDRYELTRPADCRVPQERVEKSTVTADADMAASVLAAADSFGTDTYAFVSSDLQVLNRGLVSYAFGSVTSMALASGGTGFAATTNVVDLAGAHLGTVDTHTVVDPSGAASVSTTTFAGLALIVRRQR